MDIFLGGGVRNSDMLAHRST